MNVAVVDSGVDGLHADLADHTVANFEVVGDGGGAIVQGCPLPGSGCDTDENGHGTHVAGIAVGDGSASSGFHTGIAPGAGLVGYSVGAGPSILFAVTAYDHILAHPELGVRVVNSSFGVQGGGRFDSADPINQATKRLHDAGIVVVFSNGNSGANTTDDNPPGASNCAPSDAADQCKTNPYSVAPWVISAAAAHKDGASRPRAEQHLSLLLGPRRPRPADRAQRRDDRLLPHAHRARQQRALAARPDRHRLHRRGARRRYLRAVAAAGRQQLRALLHAPHRHEHGRTGCHGRGGGHAVGRAGASRPGAHPFGGGKPSHRQARCR